MRRLLFLAALVVATIVFVGVGAQAALQLEGQGGVFLNPLAYPIAQNKFELASHHVDLSDAGSVTTYNIAYGLNDNIEVGYTRIDSGVTGVSNQNIISAKWLFSKETSKAPAFAAYAINRDLTDGDNSTDFGVIATKVVTLGGHTLILDLGARSTKAKALGLFGFADDRELKMEGAVGIFLSKKLIVATEFKQQVQSRAWRDIAVRYVVSDTLNLDAGVANMGPGLDNQVALALTRTW